jgi:hypothetical protein
VSVSEAKDVEATLATALAAPRLANR